MESLYEEAIKLIFAIAGATLVPLVTAIGVQFLRKLNLQLSAEQQAKLEHFVRLAITEAEEWAAKRAATSSPAVPAEKLERAIATVLDKVPGVTREEATQIIHAKLPELGAGAAATIGEIRVAATNEVR